MKASLPDSLRLPATTLAAHAHEHMRIGGIICDATAIRWWAQLNEQYLDVPMSDLELTNGIITRSIVIDYALLGFAGAHKRPVVADLGCGFSTRVYRLHLHVSGWIHVDLPEVIEVRQGLQPLGRSEHFYACDLTQEDDQFPSQVPARADVIFILEGVLNHLSKEQARALLYQLHARFYGASVIGTVITQNGLKGAQSLAGDLGLNKAMWAIENTNELCEWLKPVKLGRVWLLGKVASRIGLIRPTTGDEASGLVFTATL